MSEATLTKIQADCAKLESELAVYKDSKPINEACNAIVNFITSTPEPLLQSAKSEPNPWTQKRGEQGGCVIS